MSWKGCAIWGGCCLPPQRPAWGLCAFEASAREMLDALEDPGCEARALAVETCAADLEEVLQALSGGRSEIRRLWAFFPQ